LASVFCEEQIEADARGPQKRPEHQIPRIAHPPHGVMLLYWGSKACGPVGALHGPVKAINDRAIIAMKADGAENRL
jgi:hypothetical protein